MFTRMKRMNVEAAINDLRRRTLKAVAGDVARLVYLASTRDYNTGRYHHAGLALHFTEEAAQEALARCHQEVFERLVMMPLERLVAELGAYIHSARQPPAEVLRAWKTLKAYRVTIPADCHPLAAGLLLSNFRVALAILAERCGPDPRR